MLQHKRPVQAVVLATIAVSMATPVYGAEGPLPSQILQGEWLSAPVRIIIVLTILTFLPAFLLTMTSFVRFVIVFALLRNALGLQQTPPNQVIIGLALFMTLFVMSPVFNKAYTTAFEPYRRGEIGDYEALSKALIPFREFMLKQVEEKELLFFVDMAGLKDVKGPGDIPTRVLIPAFLTGELKKAFEIGFVLFVPFLVIDMVVASVLMSMGMLMLPPVLISLPFKLMLFVLVDGWTLLIGSMVRSFHL